MSAPRKPHIALISVHGDPAVEIGKEEAGGQNVYVRQVGEALARQGWQVDLFTRKTSRGQATVIHHTPNCRTIRLVAGPEAFIPRDELFEHLPTFLNALLAFQQQSGIQYPIVHTNYWLSAWVGLELKKIQGVKQVHTYHSLGAVKYQSVSAIPPIADTRLAVEKTCLEKADCIIATSPQERTHMRSLYGSEVTDTSAPVGTITIIPCGTDTKRFGVASRQIARQKLAIPEDSQVVFYVGRFDPRKGIETLVRAVSHSQLRNQPGLRLIIGGGSRPGQSDGRERERIEGIVTELGMGELTSFPGRISDADLPLYYAAADVCVVPSHYEPFGLVAVEAMASGTPVVASRVGGLEFTVVHEETGLLVLPRDELAFCTAIDRILMDPDWRDQLGQQARRRIEADFSWDGVADQLSDLYLQLCPRLTRN